MYIIAPDGIYDGKEIVAILHEYRSTKNYYKIEFRGGLNVLVETKDTQPDFKKILIVMKKLKEGDKAVLLTDIF